MNDEYVMQELQDINNLMQTWQDLEHNNWSLVSFNMQSARYGKAVNGEYIEYIHIDSRVIQFLKGVASGVLDQF